jgi:hypothetical protein
MSCKQLGGACDKEFCANSFEEITDMSRQHGSEMFAKQDKAHIEAMDKMKEMMKNPEDMKEWFALKQKEFENLPED